MNWDDLRFLLAVARKGSIRGAAQTLGVNHATVSRRLTSLEDALGARLFDRLPGGYFLTPTGEELLAAAERVEEETNGIERRVVGRDSELRGLLRVTMPDSAALKLLMPGVAEFAEAHPYIELELIPSYAIVDLSRREADVAVRFSNNPAPNLVGRRLLRMARAIYASDAYLARHDPTDGESGATWLGWNDTVPDPQWVRESPFPTVPIRNRIAHSMTQLEAAKAGMGMTFLPCFMGDTEPTLRRVRPDTVPDLQLWLLTHEDLRNTTRVRAFMDFIAAAILRERDLLEGRRPRAWNAQAGAP